MKKKRSFFALLFMAGLLLLPFTACEKDESFDADDAKQELIKATEEIQMNMFMMMATPQMESLMFFMALSDLDLDINLLKSSSFRSIASDPASIATPGINRVIDISRQLSDRHATKDIEDGGVFQYNFNTNQFDKIGDASYIEFHFPANDAAYAAQQLNGRLLIDNLVMSTVVIDGESEIVPTSVDVTLFIDNEQVMTVTFSMVIGPGGVPTGASMNMSMPPYTMNMSYSGSGTNYNMTMDMRVDGSKMLDIDLDIRYTTADMDDVERISGKAEMTPLEISGTVFPMAIDACYDAPDEVACMNNNIDLELRHTGENKRIGYLEFRMYHDPQWDDYYPELVIVYDDGTYDFLFELFDVDIDDDFPF